MRKTQLYLGLLLALFPVLGYSLNTVSFVNIEDGRIETNGVLTDEDSTIFIELTDETYIVEPDSRFTIKSGEFLPPREVEPEFANQRPYIEPVFIFEFYTDSFRRYAFTNKARQRNKAMQVLFPFNPTAKFDGEALQLWEQKDDDRWVRVGGTTRTVEGEEGKVFVAFIDGTGVYGIYNEKPEPKNNAQPYDLADIELAAKNPNPSVLSPEEELQELLERIQYLKELIANKNEETENESNQAEKEAKEEEPAPPVGKVESPAPEFVNPLPVTTIPPFIDVIEREEPPTERDIDDLPDLDDFLDRLNDDLEEIPESSDDLEPEIDQSTPESEEDEDLGINLDRGFSNSAEIPENTNYEDGNEVWFINNEAINNNLPSELNTAGKKKSPTGLIMMIVLVGLVGLGIWGAKSGGEVV